MSKIGIYPGTFDPITFGHIDVIKRSLKIVDKLIIATSNDHSKDYLFSSEERVLIIKDSIFKDLKMKKQKIKVISFNTLTTALCLKYNAKIIFRGYIRILMNINEEKDVKKKYGFWKLLIISYLIIAFLPFSILFCVVFYGINQTIEIIKAILRDILITLM